MALVKYLIFFFIISLVLITDAGPMKQRVPVRRSLPIPLPSLETPSIALGAKKLLRQNKMTPPNKNALPNKKTPPNKNTPPKKTTHTKKMASDSVQSVDRPSLNHPSLDPQHPVLLPVQHQSHQESRQPVGNLNERL